MQIKFRGYDLEVEITYFESPYPAKTNCYPIEVDLSKSSKHTGLPGDDYVLYYGKFINL